MRLWAGTITGRGYSDTGLRVNYSCNDENQIEDYIVNEYALMICVSRGTKTNLWADNSEERLKQLRAMD